MRINSLSAKLAGGLAVMALVAARPVSAQTLWYNGDFNGVDGLSSESNTSVPSSFAYDNFVVSGSGWTVTGLTGIFESSFTFSSANWEIRSGVSSGNGGSVLYNGTDAATYTSIGGAFGLDLVSSTIDVSAYSIFLAPGTYWLGISPIGSGDGRVFLATTSGANGVNAVDDNSAYFNSAFFSADFAPAGNFIGATDFALGVTGLEGTSTVPEPATMTLLATGLVGLAGAKRKRRS